MPRPLPFLFLAALFQLASPAQPGAAPQPQAKPDEPGSVSGWVVNTATGKPVERATVVLNRSVSRGASQVVMNGQLMIMAGQVSSAASQSAATDAQGRFAFSAVEPGAYVLGAVRSGFAVPADTSLQGSAGRVNVTVASGANVTDLKLRLTPEAVVSGRLMDEDGDPMPGVSVRLMHPVYSHGERQLQRIETIVSRTDDRGEYRIYDLVPGRYCLVATGGNDGAAFDRYFPMFYPGTMDHAAATLLDIKAGTQLRDMNLILLRAKVTRIRGRVIDAATNQPAAGARVTVSPKGTAFNSVSTSLATTNAQGEWEMSDMRPERVAVGAELSRGQDHLVARINVDVPSTGLDDIRLLLTPGAELAGTVRLEGEQGQSAFKPAQMRVQVQGQEYDTGMSTGALTPEGAFTIKNTRPAAYDAAVMPLPESLYLKSVRFERQETIDTGFEIVRPGSYRLDLTLGGDGAQLEGTVKDSDAKPSSGVTVLLAPSDPALRKAQRLYKTAATTHDGKYVLKGIPPGDYLLYSWEAVDPGVWFEADFLPRFEKNAVSVSVAANGRQTSDLKLIAAGPPPR